MIKYTTHSGTVTSGPACRHFTKAIKQAGMNLEHTTMKLLANREISTPFTTLNFKTTSSCSNATRL